MPNAQVIADRFHVMKQVIDELDKQRKQQKCQAEKLDSKSEKREILEAVNKSKYSLLKNKNNLKAQQKVKLEQVKKACPFLGKMYDLKEELRMIFERTDDWLIALFNLGRWLQNAVKYFPESRQTIIRSLR